MNQRSRRGALGWLGACALLSAGGKTQPMRPPNADGTECFAIGRW